MKPRIYIMLLMVGLMLSHARSTHPVTQKLELTEDHHRFNFEADAGRNIIEVSGIKPSHRYQIHWSSLDELVNNAHLIATKSSETSNSDYYEFLAHEVSATIEIAAVKKDFGVLSISCLDCHEAEPRRRTPNVIETQGGFMAEELIRDVFIGGDCYDVENVVFNGVQAMIGTFSNGNSSISMDEGVVLCTGEITQVPGPNSTTGITNTMGLTYQDPDLAQVSNNNLFDVASIEFDFRPKGDYVNFEYVFASDEYCDYNFTNFNDKFGFFISGPGIMGPFTNGAVNIAKIPGTAEDMSINTVNIDLNSAYYVDNVPLGQAQQGPYPCNTDLSVQGQAINEIEYDGFTVVLSAETELIPCETYHIKLVVADQTDGQFDSAVFLKRNSFDLGGSIYTEIEFSRDGDEFMYEDCSDGVIRFSRGLADDLSSDAIVDFTLSPLSTATPGVDYQAIPTPIIIPAGDDYIELPIIVFSDDIIEGQETIIFSIANSCSCENDEVEIIISEFDPLILAPDDQQYCETTSTVVTAISNGGLAPLTYQWDNGSTENSINVTLAETDTFYVTVTDDCGHSLDTFSIVEVINENSAYFDAQDFEFCPTDIIDFEVPIVYEGNPPFSIVIALDNIPIDSFVIASNRFMYQITQPGTYTIQTIQTQECGIQPLDELIVRVIELSATGEVTDIECDSDVLGEIELNVTGDYPPYLYSWSDGFVTNQNIAAFQEGIYSVTITDAFGCTFLDTFEIERLNGPTISLDSLRQIDCRNQTGFAGVSATGGSGQYEFSWLHSDDTTPELDSLPPGTYAAVVFDEVYLCTDVVTFEIEDESETLQVDIAGDALTCTNNPTSLELSLAKPASEYAIQWFDSSGSEIMNMNDSFLNVDVAGTYVVYIEDLITGCIGSDTFAPMEFIYQPTAVASDDDTLNCEDEFILLLGENSIYSAHSTFNWTTVDGIINGSTNAININVAAAGNYILTITDTLSSCVDYDTVMISPIPSPPEISIRTPSIINCYTPEVNLNALPFDTSQQFVYTWSSLNGNFLTTDDPLEITVLDEGVYYIEKFDLNTLCSTIDSVEVTSDLEEPSVVVSPDDTITCNDMQLTINGIGSSAGPNFSYAWTSQNGIISGSTTDLSTTIAAPGTYVLTVFNDENGCMASDSLLIRPDERLPEIVLSEAEELSCINSSAIIDATGSSQGSAFIYSWSTADGNIVSNTDSTMIETDQVGTYILEILNTDNGCSSQQAITIGGDFAEPQISIDNPESITCINQAIQLTANATTTDDDFSFLWTTENGLINSGSQSMTPIVGQAGTYYVEVINTSNGCITIDSITVEEDLMPPAIAPDDPYELNCTNSSVVVDANVSPAGLIEFHWTLPDGNMIISSTSSIEISEAGTLILSAMNILNGCSSTMEYIITENTTAPEINAGLDQVVDCGPFSMTLEAITNLNNNFEVTWTTSDGRIDSDNNQLNIDISALGTYVIEIVNLENGCTNFDNITITDDGEITAVLISYPANCNRTFGIVDIDQTSSGTPPYFYGINGAAITESDWPVELLPGTYQFEVEDAQGCYDVVSVTIEEFTELTIDFNQIDVLDYGDSVQLVPILNIDPATISSINWTPPTFLSDPQSLYPFTLPLDNIEYQLSIIDSFGCQATAFISLTIDKTVSHFTPNVFSPNNDGINDYITIFTNENIVEITSFQIFNRWGDRVFENFNFDPNDPLLGWNGRYENKVMDPAVFVYQAELLTVFGDRIRIKGDITLVK